MQIGIYEFPTPLWPTTPEMPPLDEIQRTLVLRTPGSENIKESIGGGFLRKNRHSDLQNWIFPNFVLVLVLRGSGLYVDAAGREYPLSAGSTFVRLPNVVHSNYVDEDSGYVECYLEFGPRLYAALSAMDFLLTSPPVHRIGLQNLELPRRIWRLCWKLNYIADSSLLDCTAELLSILGAIKRLSGVDDAGQKYHDLVDQACRELGENFTEEFSLQKFCRRNSIGYENFRKLFRSRTGFSPWSYRLRRKLETASLLLRDEKLTLANIAERLGYSSPYEFSAQFKRKFGVSPGIYRKTRQ